MIKGFLSKINDKVNEAAIMLSIKVLPVKKKVTSKLKETDGNWLDESFKYILAVVLGLLIIAGLYKLFKEVVLPVLEQKVKDGFNFKG